MKSNKNKITSVDLCFHPNQKIKFSVDIFYGKDNIEIIDFRFFIIALSYFIFYRFKKNYIKKEQSNED